MDPEGDRYQAILRDLRAGYSYWRVSKQHGICVNTARRIAHRHGIIRADPKVHAAAQARRSYAHSERIQLLDRALERLETMLDDVKNARELHQLVKAYAILIDRRRLEGYESAP
jgi:transposase-like protein